MEVFALLLLVYCLGRMGYRRVTAGQSETKPARTPTRMATALVRERDWSQFDQPACFRRQLAPKQVSRRRKKEPRP